jgi:hypothetical protein
MNWESMEALGFNAHSLPLRDTLSSLIASLHPGRVLRRLVLRLDPEGGICELGEQAYQIISSCLTLEVLCLFCKEPETEGCSDKYLSFLDFKQCRIIPRLTSLTICLPASESFPKWLQTRYNSIVDRILVVIESRGYAVDATGQVQVSTGTEHPPSELEAEPTVIPQPLKRVTVHASHFFTTTKRRQDRLEGFIQRGLSFEFIPRSSDTNHIVESFMF